MSSLPSAEKEALVNQALQNSHNTLEQLSRDLHTGTREEFIGNASRLLLVYEGMNIISDIVENFPQLQTINPSKLFQGYVVENEEWQGILRENSTPAQVIYQARRLVQQAIETNKQTWENISRTRILDDKPLTPESMTREASQWSRALEGEYEFSIKLKGIDFALDSMGLEIDDQAQTLTPGVKKETEKIIQELKSLPDQDSFRKEQMIRATKLGEI